MRKRPRHRPNGKRLVRMSCLALLACALLAAGAFSQPFHDHAPACDDGSCLPNTYNFGYYQTRWRRWPTSALPVQAAGSTPQSAQPLPPPETPEPRYEGDPTPPVRPPRAVPGAGDTLPPPPDLTPLAAPLPLGWDAARTPTILPAAAQERPVPPPEVSAPHPTATGLIPANAISRIVVSPGTSSMAPPTPREAISSAPPELSPVDRADSADDKGATRESTVLFRLHPLFRPASGCSGGEDRPASRFTP